MDYKAGSKNFQILILALIACHFGDKANSVITLMPRSPLNWPQTHQLWRVSGYRPEVNPVWVDVAFGPASSIFLSTELLLINYLHFNRIYRPQLRSKLPASSEQGFLRWPSTALIDSQGEREQSQSDLPTVPQHVRRGTGNQSQISLVPDQCPACRSQSLSPAWKNWMKRWQSLDLCLHTSMFLSVKLSSNPLPARRGCEYKLDKVCAMLKKYEVL